MFNLEMPFEKDAVEMRKVYASVIRQQTEADTPVIALEADLMSSMAMDGVHKDHPERVINCGIMEANVIGVAAGLSLTGRVPFVHTFTAFASRRCFDQLFMSLDYQRNNVKVIASDAGVSACHNGGTHMSFEDMGIVRGLAHSVVLEVTDATMFQDILQQLVKLQGFYWVRTIRKQATRIYPAGYRFTIGKANLLRDGSDITLIANGIMVAEALHAAQELQKRGISAAVIDMFTLKPIDREIIKTFAAKTGRIVTCENHSIHNGLGSAVAEVLVEECPVPMRRVGVKGRYGQVGTQEFLQQEYGLTAAHIVAAADELLTPHPNPLPQGEGADSPSSVGSK
ncbi:transketolase family protein [Serratia fonticola]|nr:transketolase family protein [Serratia fonticola]NTZ13308.1 transketolase family protein [Serratia fonticola]